MRQLFLCTMGANIAPEANFAKARERLKALGEVHFSHAIYTQPVAMQSQLQFLNALLLIDTSLNAEQLKKRFNAIEIELGRDRADPLSSEKDRPMDIDILGAANDPKSWQQVPDYLMTLVEGLRPLAQQLTKKYALITGAGRRFGLALAHALLDDGYQVFAHYNTSKAGVHELEQRGAIALQANLADLTQVQHLIAAVQEHTPRLHLLINNASCFFDNATVDANLEQLTNVLHVHTAAPYLLIRDLQPQLTQANGNVINITDIYVDSPATDYVAYCAAKAGLASMTLAFAKKLAPAVRVNAIQPGPILFLPEHNSEHRQKVLTETPLRLEGGLEPMIATVRFLRDNPFITGESIKVDGGRALLI